jgi:hypothetical protein
MLVCVRMRELDENVNFSFTRIPPAISPPLASFEPHNSGYTVVFTFLLCAMFPAELRLVENLLNVFLVSVTDNCLIHYLHFLWAQRQPVRHVN